MPSIIRTEPVKEGYFEETFLPDVFIGILAWVLIVPLALLLGGFMFIESWCIVIPPVTFASGMLRGNSNGNVWLKGVAMNLAILLLVVGRMIEEPFQLEGLTTALLVVLVTVVPTVGGIAFRRWRLLTRTRPKSSE